MPSVLIVDENAVVRKLVRDCIETDTNWRVCGEAENGEIAIEKVKTLRPDVVILDLQMPVMNGLEAAKEIRQTVPETAMVMFTMHNSNELMQEAQAIGIQEVLSKSDRIAENLLATLRRMWPPRIGKAVTSS